MCSVEQKDSLFDAERNRGTQQTSARQTEKTDRGGQERAADS